MLSLLPKPAATITKQAWMSMDAHHGQVHKYRSKAMITTSPQSLTLHLDFYFISYFSQIELTL